MGSWKRHVSALQKSRHILEELGSRWGTFIRPARSAVLGLLFPPVCTCCDNPLEQDEEWWGLCGECRRALTGTRAACIRCGRPLPAGRPPFPQGCGGCWRKRFRFQQTVALGVYGDSLRDVVLRMKGSRDEALTLAVGRLLGDKCRTMGLAEQVDMIVPVPTHWRRRIWRGSNSPELLGESVAACLQRPLARRLLRCRRKTRKQGTLLPYERRQNVRRAYKVSKGYDIDARHLLLVDDVMTSGATANELARVLHRAGAGRVTVAVAARGIGFE